MYKTIGFFGDSFCTKLDNPHSVANNYKTYIQKTKSHYNLEIVNLGFGASSVWDALLIQLDPLIKANKVPDICVFTWTIPGRLFDRTARCMHSNSAIKGYDADKEKWFAKEYPGKTNPFTKEIWEAGKQFYMYLFDQEKEDLEHLAILQYIDNNILTKLPKTTKVIHFWSFAQPRTWGFDGFHPDNISYTHDWKHGVEVRPALISLSIAGDERNTFHYPKLDDRPNHLDGEEKNDLMFSWIKTSLENYEDGKILNFTDQVCKLWKN
jgi:hypothetical protein